MRPEQRKLLISCKNNNKKCVRRKVKQCRKKAALCRYVCVSLSYVCLCVWTLQFAPPLPPSPLTPSLLQKRQFAATFGDRYVASAAHTITHTHTHAQMAFPLCPISPKQSKTWQLHSQLQLNTFLLLLLLIFLVLGSLTHTHTCTQMYTRRDLPIKRNSCSGSMVSGGSNAGLSMFLLLL